MINIVTSLNFIQFFAAAGGGGSSSSGEGGGGILIVLFLASYIPTYKMGKRYRKRYREDKDDESFKQAQIKTWSVTIAISAVAIIAGIFLGDLIAGILLGLLLILGAVLGAGSGLYAWFDAIKPNKKVQAQLAQSATSDSIWNEEFLRQGSAKIYSLYQQDWSNFNLANMKTYMTPRYYNHVELMMSALWQMNRRNVVTVREIDSVEIVNISDSVDNSLDMMTVGFSTTLEEALIDTKSNTVISQWLNTDEANEYWRFQRDGNSWRLDGINPLTESERTREQQIQAFANSVNAYYTLDWGRLLLPTGSQLFDYGLQYQTGDINNHVIGKLADSGRTYTDKLIYQIYTYSPLPANAGGPVYLIGQITVPKYYGNIVIRRRKGLFQSKIKGLVEVTLEWLDFNKKYQVFATSAEQVTSFELLNPQVMQWIEAVPFELNLEVVNNSIYFYAPWKNVSTMTDNDYRTMLGILQAAYRELKL
ncbi:MAG: TIM44-like domain-containing protein [Candidatus Saccharibacteria bacterium]|nr:TIM44-like domain-containing protein [Candidatus Saccharibacteria bacterium]